MKMKSSAIVLLLAAVAYAQTVREEYAESTCSVRKAALTLFYSRTPSFPKESPPDAQRS
jgi:hypothetical protein